MKVSEPPRAFVKPGQGVHLMTVADSEDQRRSTLCKWIVSGLAEGEGFAYAEPEGGPVSRSVAAALAGTGVDVDQARRDGLLVQIPLPELYAVDAPARLVAQAQAQGLRALRIAADARHGLQVLDEAGYLRFERRLAEACATTPLSALCQFDTEAAGIWFSEVSWLHTGYGPASPFMAVPVDDAVFLFGEVDISNDEQMTDALRRAAGQANGQLRIDMAGLSLFTAAGCRALIEGTEDYRARGGQVLLGGARPSVQRILSLLGFDQAPGFTMAKDRA